MGFDILELKHYKQYSFTVKHPNSFQVSFGCRYVSICIMVMCWSSFIHFSMYPPLLLLGTVLVRDILLPILPYLNGASLLV
jgi:hypothetical protein